MAGTVAQQRAVARLIAFVKAAPQAPQPRTAKRRKEQSRLLIDGPTEQHLTNGRYEIATVGHDVVLDGDGNVKDRKPVKAYRRDPLIATMRKRGTLDADLYAACAWYLERHDGAGQGIRSCLDVRTGSGSGLRGPSDEAIAGAQNAADLEWARRFIPAAYRGIFDAVVLADETYAAIGASLFPGEKIDTSSRRVKLRFQMAAAKLHEAIAHRLQVR